jgi:hypothetical protein
MKKRSYFSGNDNYGEEYYPYNEFIPTGMVQEYGINLDRYENKQRDGKDFDEFKQFKRKNRIKKLRKLLKSRKKSKHTTLQPTQFYESLYGTPSDFTGLNSSPLEYYSGTITDSPDSLLNPYQNSYQSACDRNIRIKIRAMIFADHIRKQA